MKKLVISAVLLALPVNAWGSGCNCGAINMMISNAKMQTVQEVNAHTTAESEAIRSEIIRAAQNIIGTIKAESATIVRAIVALKESNAANMKDHEIRGYVRQSGPACRIVRLNLPWGGRPAFSAGRAGNTGDNARKTD